LKLVPGPLADAYLLEPTSFMDDRGSFSRVFDSHELGLRGLDSRVALCCLSVSHQKGTLRGMHYQTAPHSQAKVVRCSRGAIFDVLVDIRPSTLTPRSWWGVELSASSLRSLYVPPGVAHGFLTLEENTEVTYLISHERTSSSERGVLWNDPAFGIDWPFEPSVISDRDASYQLWTREYA
jgi:dTDP-4-dehydrorhamnose 3,5-epimerase